jgi:hypothetical protein
MPAGPARPRSHPGGPTAADPADTGRPNPTRDRPTGGRPTAFTADGPVDPTAGRGEDDRPARAVGVTRSPVLGTRAKRFEDERSLGLE